MKAKKFLWSMLPVMAALVLTACSSSDDSFDKIDQPTTAKGKIPVTISVGTDNDVTRATVDNNNSTLRFAAGDVLYFSNADGSIHGSQAIPASAVGKTEFSVETTLEADDPRIPADGEVFTVRLVGANNKALTISNGKVTGVNYANAVTTDVANAVQQYSDIKGSGEYKDHNISVSLRQNTAFLNFTVTYSNIFYTATAAQENIVVTNNNATIGSGKITTTVSRASNLSTVKASFVVPVAKGTKMNNASVKVGTFDAIKLTSTATLEGKVYNVDKKATLPNVAVGNIVGRNGKIYATIDAAVSAGTTAVGIIAYVGNATADATYKHGLVLGLKDCSSPFYHWCNPANQGNSWRSGDENTVTQQAEDGSALTYPSVSRNNSSWPAFQAAINNSITTTARITKVVDQATKQSQIQGSKWFLPSVYQWNQIVRGLSGKTKRFNQYVPGEGDDFYKGDNVSTKIVKTGNSGAEALRVGDGIYWSSSDATLATDNSSKAWVYDARVGRIEMNSKKRTGESGNRVRPVFAF